MTLRGAFSARRRPRAGLAEEVKPF